MVKLKRCFQLFLTRTCTTLCPQSTRYLSTASKVREKIRQLATLACAHCTLKIKFQAFKLPLLIALWLVSWCLLGNGTYKVVNPMVSSVGDFTPFYIVIAICSVILGFMIILNVAFCCSRYSDYWLDRHTGNRWIVSIWSATPHKQPPLDFTELKNQEELGIYIHRDHAKEYHLEEVPASISQQPLTSQIYELEKRESDI